MRVCLYDKQRKHRYFRHRLVAENYIPNPNDFKEVNHIDMNRENNSVTNLEWCDRKYNELHSRINGKGTKPYKPFIVIFDDDRIKRYDVTTDLAKEINVSKTSVRYWLHKKNKSYLNYGIKEIRYEWE